MVYSAIPCHVAYANIIARSSISHCSTLKLHLFPYSLQRHATVAETLFPDKMYQQLDHRPSCLQSILVFYGRVFY